MVVTEKRTDSSLVYDGQIIKVFKDKVSLEGKPAVREVVRHKGAAAILAVNENGEAFFVEQFRYPMEKPLLEASAGKIDEGENPIECAKRELMEECGISAEKWTELGPMFSSPGFCDEIIYLFLAEELSYSVPNPDEDEFLDVIKMPLSEALCRVRRGEIPDAKTQVLILRCADIIEHR